MPQQNGYFQIEIVENDSICHFYPPSDGGVRFPMKEALEYLTAEGYTDFDMNEFSSKLNSDTEETMYIGIGSGSEFSEYMKVRVSLDRMKAVCRFMPPSLNGSLLDSRDIINRLNNLGIIFGIDQDAIIEFFNDRCYATDYNFANGKLPRIGHDAKIEYFFNTNPTLKPKLNEDGSVNYKELNTICEVKKGDLLARLIPADMGERGKDIYGKEIPTREVHSKKLSFSRNVEINEDKTEIRSNVDGHVALIDDQVFVSDVLEIPADVDNSTGNINYSGNVHIAGNVRGGFTVSAGGDIVVDGVVEAAFLKAGGQIIVKCGIHGKHRGMLESKSNVISRFIENARVFAGGYVEAGSILYSDVNAGGDVLVEEKKGFILGGVVRAGGKVLSQTIGSDMGAPTRIEVGIAPEKKERYAFLNKEITGINMKINRITPVMRTYSDFLSKGGTLDDKNREYMQMLLNELNDLRKNLQGLRTEYNALHQDMLHSVRASVDVRRDVFPGVTVAVSELSTTTKEKRSFCRFQKKNGRVEVTNL